MNLKEIRILAKCFVNSILESLRFIKIPIAALVFISMFVSNAMAAVCSVSPNPISFGIYSVTSATDNTKTSTFSVTCSDLLAILIPVSYTVSFSAGNSGNFANRSLISGANVLGYNIFKNSARTQILGNGTGGTSVYSMSYNFLLSRTDNFTIYSRIPALQSVRSGSYTDNISVTVTW